MAHRAQQAFCERVKKRYPDHFQRRNVLDIGSLDINGSNRPLFEDCCYTGLDVEEGSNVDVVCKAHELLAPDGKFDTVISTETLEHDMFYKQSLQNMIRLLCQGGLLVFTCATAGRGEHGTRRCSPCDSPLTVQLEEWQDYYKNLTEDDIRNVLDIDSIFGLFEFEVEPYHHDLRFWGIKAGANLQ